MVDLLIIGVILNEISIFINLPIDQNSEIKNETKFHSIYNFTYGKLSADFGHYFRNLYRIIKIVDQKEFSKDAIENFKIQYSYTSIIRAQLSDEEIKWNFFNCLSNNGHEKFKPLIEKYSFLKILNKDGDDVYAFYSQFYEKCAFEKPIESILNNFKVINLQLFK
tara:strand:- start:163989 stop:164483 length:495 start_codon:yes stop_codon:yes gene_type:complete